MRKITLLFVLSCLLYTYRYAQGQTVTYSGNMNIQGTTVSNFNFNIVDSDTQALKEIHVYGSSHNSFVGTIEGTLTSPTGQQDTIFRMGFCVSPYQDFDVHLKDEFSTTADLICYQIIGNYKPINSFGNFTPPLQGTWQLSVRIILQSSSAGRVDLNAELTYSSSVINCGSDLVVESAPDCNTVVNYPLPSVSANVPPAEIPGFSTVGYKHGSMFYISDSLYRPSDAYADAHNRGGYVATVVNAQVNQFLKNYLTSHNVGGTALIGYNDVAQEGMFIWDSGAGSTFTNWNTGEPNNTGGNEDYTEIQISGGWNDIPDLSQGIHYILEIPGKALTLVSGLQSGSVFPVGTTEVVYEATNRYGISGQCSFQVTVEDHTRPQMVCPSDMTINISYAECDQTVNYSWPSVTDCSEIPPESIQGFTTIGYSNGSMYYLSDNIYQVPADAYMDAHSRGGYVATVKNARVNQFLTNYLSTNAITEALIGYNDIAQEGTFVWDSGSNATYNNWNNGEPNNTGGNEDYTEIQISGGWNDIPDTLSQGIHYILEIPGRALTLVSGLPPGSIYPLGTTTNVFEVMDKSGNPGTCRFDVKVKYNDFPDDITVNADPGYCDANVTYNMPSPAYYVCIPPAQINGFNTIGYIDGSMYYLSTDTLAAHTAFFNADINSVYIATVKNAAVNQFLTDYLVANNVDRALIGLNDISHEGTFVWHSGSTSTYTNWNAGEPNNYDGNEDYTEIQISGRWNDINADSTRKYIWEIPGKSFELTSGLPSGSYFPIGVNTVSMEALSRSGDTIHYSFKVTVQDNQSPVLECLPDTIVDAAPDNCGAVVTFDMPSAVDNCTLPLEIMPGFNKIGSVDGSVFYISVTPVPVQSIFDDARVNGGFVATVSNEARNGLIANYLAANNIPAAWIGFNDVNNEGVFVWQDGSPVNFTNWNTGEPNGGHSENYTEIFSSGLWNDSNSTILIPYILEIPGTLVRQTAGLPSGSTFPIGTTTNIFEVTDRGGNTSTCSFNVTVRDNTAPVITCLSDTTVMFPTGQYYYVLPDYIASGDVTASDNCNFTLSQNPPASTHLGTGVHTITFEAVDSAGNTGTCSFNLTVNSNLSSGKTQLNAMISVYPNPAKNLLNVKSSQLTIKKITLYDLLGRKLKEFDAREGNKQEIDISDLSPAGYLLKIDTGKGTVTKSFHKN